ncbi:MAG TPA: ATP-dependent helicase [Acidimicrobiales bacterium]|nr:ATP-dependent helicase [Acidimicrobiales bacterium]
MFEVASWDEGLDEAQIAVATHGRTPLVVVAGAGTGKTRALTARVACLLERGTPAERILLLTFTRRAADEMLARAAFLARLGSKQRPRGGTFHAVAHRYIAAYAENLGLPKGFSVLDPAEACDLMDLLRGQHDLTGTTARFPRPATLVEIYSRAVNTGRPISEVVPLEFPWCEPHVTSMAELFRTFTARKRKAALLDFDDLLLYWRALVSHEPWGRGLSEKFDYVLVDEYQDVNGLQVDIVRALSPDGSGLTVVGDEAQAIYGFRGSMPGQMRQLVLAYPGASVIRLEHNFRSRQPVLDVANALRPAGDDTNVLLYSSRPDGRRPRLVRCHDAPAEAKAIADAVLTAYEGGTPLRHQAVLVRASHHSDLVEVELSVRKVPYRKYGGLKFLEAAHVKDFVSAARLLDNSHDEVAWYRLLRLHERLGPASARSLTEIVLGSADDPVDRWPELVAQAPAPARSSLSGTLNALASARAHTAPGRRAEGVLQAVRPLVLGRYTDAAVRLGDLERLAGAAAAATDLATWLAELVLDPPAATGDLAGPPALEEDYVVISTVHSAKGLEWPIVHIPQVIDGSLPIDMALGSASGLEEERRLFYVAVTRARDELHMYTPLRMPHHRRARDDRHNFATVSRFVDQAVLATLEVVESSPERFTLSSAGLQDDLPVDIDALWG